MYPLGKKERIRFWQLVPVCVCVCTQIGPVVGTHVTRSRPSFRFEETRRRPPSPNERFHGDERDTSAQGLFNQLCP
jgi:hypothetical protein